MTDVAPSMCCFEFLVEHCIGELKVPTASFVLHDIQLFVQETKFQTEQCASI